MLTGVGGSTVTSAFVVEQMPRAVHRRAGTRWTRAPKARPVVDAEAFAESASEPHASAPSTRNPDERSEPSSHTRKLETSIGSAGSLGANRKTTTGRSVEMALPIGGCTSAKFGAQLLSVLSRAKLAGDDSAVVWQEADRMVPLDNNTSVVLNVIDAVGNTLCVHAGEDTLERWFGC